MNVRCLALVPLLLLGCSSYDDEAPQTVGALVPMPVTVHEQESKSFELQGREVRLTHVAYGALNDCSAGCFSSHVCAIEDGGEVTLFHAFWTSRSEEPKEVAKVCPDASGKENGASCTPSPPHPLTQTEDFKEFVKGDDATKGPVRWCIK